jgi:hypothetical protein
MYSRAILPPPTTTLDLVHLGQLFEGLGVLLEALGIAACQDGAAKRIDEYHEGRLASEGIKRFLEIALAIPLSQNFANGLGMGALDLLEDGKGGFGQTYCLLSLAQIIQR